MTRHGELESVLSMLKTVDFKQNVKLEDVQDLFKYFDTLLDTADGVNLLKQQNKNFEVVLPVFTRVIYCDDLNVAKCFFKYFEVVIDIFRSKLPKIKKGEWWKRFELELLVKSIPKLAEKVSPSDGSWVEIWSFTANLIVSDTALSTLPLNTLLSISETSFKKGKEHPEILDQAWKCWVALIDAFGRSPKILLPSKTLNLLLKPLLACHSVSKLRVSTWIHLIEVKGIPVEDDTVKQLTESFCKAMFNSPGERAISRHLPEECAEALVKLLSYGKVVEHCLEELVGVFGACISSKPASNSIEKLTSAFAKAINDCENEGFSFKLCKVLLEQLKNESPIIFQACQIFFAEVNFQKWIDSGTIGAKDMNELMRIPDFRSKVFLRSVNLLSSIVDDENDTPRKKSKKCSPEAIWSNYCATYLTWWSANIPPSPKENGGNKTESSLRDGHDYEAMLALILYPIQQNSWGPAISKTWTSVCETCHKHRLLQLMSKQIIDELEHSQVGKSIDILTILFGIDSYYFKPSIKMLETLVPKVYSMEDKSIMELLNLCEVAVTSNELTAVISKILKTVNEIASSESDQLNAHKIRTKVGKISRKVEQLCNSLEKDKPAKSQRTPFRTQSNFLQRLAKAEEKNKNKNPFLSSMFSPTDRNKSDDNGEGEHGISELPSQDTSLESINAKFTDEVSSKKSLKLLDDSENVPIIMPLMSPSILKEGLSSINGEKDEREVIAAEKENVIVTSSSAPLAISPANKMKITNARELKIVDASSPSVVKKAKPLAGQKVTPKKATPSKVVSYFDDDANDCVMVPPKPKTTPLTEHQMEMMTKRRTDIPAMYQDLSQDTQISNSTIIQEMKNGVSPMETEDIVHATPSPLPASSLVTPERPKNQSKTGSAKKLDFNSLVSISSKELDENLSHVDVLPIVPLTHDTQSEKQLDITSNNQKSISIADTDSNVANVENSESANGDGNKQLVSISDLDCVEHSQIEKSDSNGVSAGQSSNTPKDNQTHAAVENTKRKRKSEPIKFSPKLTRSKKSLNKTVTPDAKLSKSFASELSTGEASNHRLVNKEAVEVRKTERKPEEIIDDLPAVNTLQEVPNDVAKCPPAVVTEEKIAVSPSETDHQSQNMSEVVEDLQRTSTSRKRKCEDASSSEGEGSKKSKLSDDETPSKKVSSSKKKKKPFKLSSGNNNLENWLVKTERVPNSATSQSCVVNKGEENHSQEIASSEPLASDSPSKESDSADLNNSEEIVPSTQELDRTSLLDSAKSILSSKIKDESQEQPAVNGDEFVNNVVKVDPVSEELRDPCVEIKREPVKTQDPNPTSHESNEESSKKNENSVLQELALESPNDDDVDLIICSPTKRHKRASSVLRGEGDTYLTKDTFLSDGLEEGDDDFSKRSLRCRERTSSSSTRSRKSLHPPGGRSARMLRLAASSTSQDEENGTLSTPLRKRENIVPMTYGENWPKGPTEDWVACAPSTPYSSPFRSVLKRTPLRSDEGQVTPQRSLMESFASPLLSSPKRKRVVFLDPPVTKGLIYERDSPFGAVHLADVPHGSPYPTWKDNENGPSRPLPTPESLPVRNTTDNHVDLITPIKVSEEVHELIDGIIEKPFRLMNSTSNDLEYFKDKYCLDDSFVEQFSQLSPLLKVLVAQCFEHPDMEKTIDEWKLSDCRKICELPHSFLSLVKNEKGQSLMEIFKAVNLIPPVVEVPATVTAESQTDPATVPISHSACQTELQTCSVETNTISINTVESSTQADQQLPLPGEVLPILEKLGSKISLEYLSEYLKSLSSIQDVAK